MDRRVFLKSIVASGAVVSVSLFRGIGYSGIPNESLSINIIAREEDFDHGLGIAIKFNDLNGELVRHGIYIDDWSKRRNYKDAVNEIAEKTANLLNDWLSENGIKHFQTINEKQILNAIDNIA